ncbi:hypothetical protein DPMN_019560 [Dreissena polymorpha]|uniref:THAP-type domain-containing protein n=1 Tax=Dreissena polymorpha TaxID=45954 RepID=A0A9D4S8B2_DREPO|nr:hypothetical protein DPMN_019560 [Dreissena polymorpha]
MDDLSNLEHKSTEKKRNYCCICSNFRGKLVDGKQVRLHRFPADEKVRKLWIKRPKTVSTGFVLKIKNDRLCSAHFVDGIYNSKNQIPSIFMVNNKQKIFKTSEVCEFLFVKLFLLSVTRLMVIKGTMSIKKFIL